MSGCFYIFDGVNNVVYRESIAVEHLGGDAGDAGESCLVTPFTRASTGFFGPHYVYIVAGLKISNGFRRVKIGYTKQSLIDRWEGFKPSLLEKMCGFELIDCELCYCETGARESNGRMWSECEKERKVLSAWRSIVGGREDGWAPLEMFDNFSIGLGVENNFGDGAPFGWHEQEKRRRFDQRRRRNARAREKRAIEREKKLQEYEAKYGPLPSAGDPKDAMVPSSCWLLKD